MNKQMKRAINGAIGLIFRICFFLMFLIIILLLVFLPGFNLSDMLDVAKYGAPRQALPFIILFGISGMLYLSMRLQSLRSIYLRYPVLMPALQMGFIMTAVTNISLMIMNLWADNLVISKTVAITGAIFVILLGRVFISYWYYKYPVSLKMRRY